jgi:hypothetical protein
MPFEENKSHQLVGLGGVQEGMNIMIDDVNAFDE